MLLTATPASKQLVEAFDAVKWVAHTPMMDRMVNTSGLETRMITKESSIILWRVSRLVLVLSPSLVV
jgi:hypothetical protein